MITNIKRTSFVPKAIANFQMQKHPEKKLIILNHSPGHIFLKQPIDNVHEFYIDKLTQKFSLGGLRNIALETCIPRGALWTTFDDDDWRRDDYLSTLYSLLKFNRLDLLFLKKWLEYNENTNFTFKSQFKKGWAFFLARKIDATIYDDVDTLEDSRVEEIYKKNGKQVARMNNDPKIYIRVIHSNNTSIFVDPNKNNIVDYAKSQQYQEFEASQAEKDYVMKALGTE